MIYRAYANQKEISSFKLGGKDVKEIWGGNTLLWKKDETLTLKELFRIYSRYTSSDGILHERSISLMNQSEDGEIYISNMKRAAIAFDYVVSKPGITPAVFTNYYLYAYVLLKAEIQGGNATKDKKLIIERWRSWKDGKLVEDIESRSYISPVFSIGDGCYTLLGTIDSTGLTRHTILASGMHPQTYVAEGMAVFSKDKIEDMKAWVLEE